MEIGWTDVGSGGYILVSCAHSNTSFLLSSMSNMKTQAKMCILHTETFSYS
jgi:galactokinase/mevalonate kinase-like predicted kinase